MVVLKEEITVKSSKEDAFSFIAQFANTCRWDPGVKTSEQLGNGVVQVGTKYSLVTLFKGKESDMEYVITEYKPSEKVVLDGKSAIVSAHDVIEFFDTGVPEETRICYTADIRLKGIYWLATPFVYSDVMKLGKEALDGMASAFQRQEHLKHNFCVDDHEDRLKEEAKDEAVDLPYVSTVRLRRGRRRCDWNSSSSVSASANNDSSGGISYDNYQIRLQLTDQS